MSRHHDGQHYQGGQGGHGGHGGQGGARGGGIPDGLLVGLLGFLLGLAVLVWTATGLAGLFTHGAWPQGVTFPRTPLAIRQLVQAPHDIAGAWPDTPPGELSGYGLFWGLLISQMMVLVVLTVFVLGVTARYRVVRARRRAGVSGVPNQAQAQTTTPAPAPEPAPQLGKEQYPSAVATTAVPAHQPPPAPEPVPESVPTPVPVPAPDPVQTATPTPAPAPAPTPVPAHAAAVPAPRVRYGNPIARRPAAVQAILEAEGPALVVTSDPTVWSETKDARAKLGPVLVYDPGHLCDTPARLHWSPTAGCEDATTAAARAAALLSPVRPHALLDAAMADTAETLLRCWLHAAAVESRPFKQVHRWAQGGNAHEAVRILRTHPKAASGLAGLLESALTAHPERREVAQQLTARALSALSSIHIRDACTPNRTDSLVLDSFVNEGGTLYVVGEPIEDPRSRPGAMPLLTALASNVVEHGRRMAARSSDGRLDPPMTCVLDDVAAVAPLPQLPELLSTGHDRGLPTLALLRSRQQGLDRWPHYELPVPDSV
ncbi:MULTISPECIES: type IV secretory system conjugative DNA transfer family protein [unclassified Streptomyces]|uniref:type IV secretory system conjugative DNA transfer family protein n=1 Tax=unclassified Streptomyces TaxID=2593676 RepID=UPI00342ED444